jgi:transcriptional regulator with XRE-family HTH domain
MEEPETIADRMIRLRESLGKNGVEMARDLGISPQRWNNVERGLPLGRELAFMLVEMVPGLTLDWLYLGRREGLTLRLDKELEAAKKQG